MLLKPVRRRVLLFFWWSFWVGCSAVEWMFLRSGQGDLGPDEMLEITYFGMFVDGWEILTALLTFFVVRIYARMEETLFELPPAEDRKV